MTLVHFEGFDLYTAGIETGLDGGGDQDISQYWETSTVYRMSFVPGVNSQGQACRVVEQMFTRSPHIVVPFPRARIGFWGKLFVAHEVGDPGVVSTGSDFCAIGKGNTEAPVQRYAVHVGTTGVMSLQYNGSTMTGSATSTEIDADTFRYYEFYVDSHAGTATLYHNGAAILTGTGGGEWTDATSLAVYFGSNQPGLGVSRYYPIVDNFWLTNGPRPWDEWVGKLHDDEIFGVSVVSVCDSHGSDGFVDGHIDFSSTELSEWEYAGVHTTTNIDSVSYDDNKNIGNGLRWFWFTDPRTSTQWSQNKYDAITSFGLCFYHNENTNDFRVVNLGLDRLTYNFGKPLVKTAIPGAEAIFTAGTWTKSDPSLSFQAHVRHIPRKNDTHIDETLSLYTHTQGCIGFKVGIDSGPIDDEPFDKIGITFAEEFREDLHDWTRVFGTGGGLDFNSFFKSGYSIFGQDDKKFQDNYVTVNYNNLPGGQCYIQGLWDFAYSADTGRWSMKQLVYADPYKNESFTHAPRKLKIRGNGKAMQLYVTSYKNSPFKINGWTIFVTTNQAV